tara:strand:- start:80 stop:289 length:210 start_codon:yes stop_codon:yes gene_type:complete
MIGDQKFPKIVSLGGITASTNDVSAMSHMSSMNLDKEKPKAILDGFSAAKAAMQSTKKLSGGNVNSPIN